jgi:hypothetical protein
MLLSMALARIGALAVVQRTAAKIGPSPVDRGRRGSKHPLLVDGGVPLAWTLTGSNRNDVTQLLQLLDRLPLVRASVARNAGRRR